MSRDEKELAARRQKLKDTWLICFALGFIMMNYPFLSIFNKPQLAFDVPMLFLYLLLGWLVSILIVYLFSRAASHETERRGRP